MTLRPLTGVSNTRGAHEVVDTRLVNQLRLRVAHLKVHRAADGAALGLAYRRPLLRALSETPPKLYAAAVRCSAALYVPLVVLAIATLATSRRLLLPLLRRRRRPAVAPTIAVIAIITEVAAVAAAAVAASRAPAARPAAAHRAISCGATGHSA